MRIQKNKRLPKRKKVVTLEKILALARRNKIENQIIDKLAKGTHARDEEFLRRILTDINIMRKNG